MHSARVISLLAVLTTIALYMSPVAAECCYCNGGHCNDGTICKPYCGYRPCNIWGCNCGGGCRHTGFPARASTSIEDASEYYFDQADTNHDGKLSFDEWVNVAQNEGADEDELAERWAKFDTGNVGYLTKDQSISLTG